MLVYGVIQWSLPSAAYAAVTMPSTFSLVLSCSPAMVPTGFFSRNLSQPDSPTASAVARTRERIVFMRVVREGGPRSEGEVDAERERAGQRVVVEEEHLRVGQRHARALEREQVPAAREQPRPAERRERARQRPPRDGVAEHDLAQLEVGAVLHEVARRAGLVVRVR